MSNLRITVDSKRLQQALQQGPKVLQKQLKLAVLRTVKEMAREAKRGAPKAESILTNSIHHRMADPLTGLVLVGADYGRMVEEGTGPGGWPPVQDLIDWIRVQGITPNDPEMDERDLAFTMARSIAINGTPAQPYLRPAFASKKARAEQLINQAIDRAIEAING